MPGSYRVQNHIIQQTSPLQGAKTLRQSTIDSQSSQSQPPRQGSEGKWSEQENLRFCIFVHYFQDIFTSKHKRKICKIYKPFAEYLTSRSATQCRSHFQKMMEKHKSITKMKKYYKNLKGQTSYRKFYDAFKMQWERSHQPISKTHPEIKEFKQFAIQTEPIHPSQTRCDCGHNPSQADLPSKSNQIVSPPFWSENTTIQSITGGNYFLWIPNLPNLLSLHEVNIQS